jgi:hypothetical protein
MRQSWLMSLVEAGTNVVVGYGIAVLTQMAVFPMFGLSATISQNLAIGAIFTVVSLTRSYVLRRLFEASCRSIAPTGRTGSQPPG